MAVLADGSRNKIDLATHPLTLPWFSVLFTGDGCNQQHFPDSGPVSQPLMKRRFYGKGEWVNEGNIANHNTVLSFYEC